MKTKEHMSKEDDIECNKKCLIFSQIIIYSYATRRTTYLKRRKSCQEKISRGLIVAREGNFSTFSTRDILFSYLLGHLIPAVLTFIVFFAERFYFLSNKMYLQAIPVHYRLSINMKQNKKYFIQVFLASNCSQLIIPGSS